MKVTADAAAAVIAEPEGPPKPLGQAATPAVPPEDGEAAVAAMEVVEDAEAMKENGPQESITEPPGVLFAPGACTDMVDDAEKAGADASQQDPQAMPGEPSLKELAASVEMAKAAEKHGILWARVKGFPYWPAQVMKGKPAEVRMNGVHRPSQNSLPVMFFGTLEIAWMSPAELTQWGDGIKAKLHFKPKGKRFETSLQQAADFAVMRKWPQNWWSRRPPQPKAQEDPASAADMKREADVPAPPGGIKRPVKAAKKVEGADSRELKDLIGEEDLADVPKRKAAAPSKPPPYQQLRCNLWVSRSRPKRMPKDDIPVCNCRPVLPRSPLQQRPSSAGPPLSPTKRQSVIALAADLACNRLPRPDSAPPTVPPQAIPWGLPPPQVASSEAPSAAGSIPQPDKALDVATSVPQAATQAMQAPAPEQVLPTLTEPASPSGASASLPEAHAALAQFTAAPPMPAATMSAQAVRTGCGDNCLNRLSYIHCDPRLCPCGQQCSNRPFSMLQLPKMDLFPTENRGWGVRAAAPIPRGAFIVEYAGEVVDDVERNRRMADAKASGEHNFYMMEMGPGLIIDARTKGTLARFINSSCAPNCEAQKWHDAATGEIRVGIFAAQDIDPGVELTYDYMFQHAGTAALAGAYRCMCGAPNCRGTMDTQPERFKDFGKRLDVFWDGDSVFYRGTVTAYSTTTRKHTILYDDNDVERVNLETVKHRWLEESAPIKLSPLREALEAGKTLLGDELPPLDLGAGPQPKLPAIMPPLPDAAETAALSDAAEPDQAGTSSRDIAVPQDTATPALQPELIAASSDDSAPIIPKHAQQKALSDVDATARPHAEIPSPEAALNPAENGLEVPVLVSSSPRTGCAHGRGRGRGRGRLARGQDGGRSNGRGKKRKAEVELDMPLAQESEPLVSETPAPLEEEHHVQMPKHKMWLKRCQRESEEQDSPPRTAQPPVVSTELPAESAQFACASPRRAAQPSIAGTEEPAEPAQFTHISSPRKAQPPTAGTWQQAEPAQVTRVSSPRSARQSAAKTDLAVQPGQFAHGFPAQPAHFTHLSALPALNAQELMPELSQRMPKASAEAAAAYHGRHGTASERQPNFQQQLKASQKPVQELQQELQALLGSQALGRPKVFPDELDQPLQPAAAPTVNQPEPDQPLQPAAAPTANLLEPDHAMQPTAAPRVICPEPDQALQPAAAPRVNQHEPGQAAEDSSMQPAEVELTPDRMLQPWQSLSAQPAKVPMQPLRSSTGYGRGYTQRSSMTPSQQVTSALGYGRGSAQLSAMTSSQPEGSQLGYGRGLTQQGAMPTSQQNGQSLGYGMGSLNSGSLTAADPILQGQLLHRAHQGAPPQSNLQTGVGSTMPLHCAPLPQGVPRLPSNLNPLGVHVAMYNMLLLQNPHLRAQLPPLPTTLGGLPSLPPPSAQWTVPQVQPSLPDNVPAAAPLASPYQGHSSSSQVLPQWPQLDFRLSSGLQPSLPPQQPASLGQSMHAPYMSSTPAPAPSPVLATLQAALKAQTAVMAKSPRQSAANGILPTPTSADTANRQLRQPHFEAADIIGNSQPAVMLDPQAPLSALPRPTGTGVAQQLPQQLYLQTADAASWQPPQPHPGVASAVGNFRPAVLPSPHSSRHVPLTLAASQQTAASTGQAAPDSVEMSVAPPVRNGTPQHPSQVAGQSHGPAAAAEGAHPTGQAQLLKNASKAQGVSAQERPTEGLQETGSQSTLAASMSASILGDSHSLPVVDAEASALAPHMDGSVHQPPTEASAPTALGPAGPQVSSAPGAGVGQDDISRALGQAEASRLLGVRDDLDQLGPGQPDVPCCGSKGAHAELPAGPPNKPPPQYAGHEGAPKASIPEQQLAGLPDADPCEQSSLQGLTEPGSLQHAADPPPQHSSQHMTLRNSYHDMAPAETVMLQASQHSLPFSASAPHAAAIGVQPAGYAADVPTHAPGQISSEGLALGSHAAVSKPAVGNFHVEADVIMRASKPQASIGSMQDNMTAGANTDHIVGAAKLDVSTSPPQDIMMFSNMPQSLPPPEALPELCEGGGFGYGHMQQPITPRLFDPTALLANGQSPAMNGFGGHISPPHTIHEGPPAAVLPGPSGNDSELWSFLVDSPSPVPKAKHMAWAAQQSPCYWKQNGMSHAPHE